MKVGVVACTYNGEAYLAEQLSTFLTQSRMPDEIVISDDASTDGSWELIQAFASKARARKIRVTAVRQPDRLGYVGNFSRALEMATTDIVFLCDQDDAWHPDKVATMAAAFEADPALIFLHSDARLVDASGTDIGHGLFEALEVSEDERSGVRDGDAFTVYLRRNLATGAASAFRRSLLDVALPLPAAWIHDAWLAVLAAGTGRIAIIDDPLIDYRQHGGNQIGVARRTRGQRFADMFRARNETLRKDAARLEVLIVRFEEVGIKGPFVATTRAMRDHLTARVRIGGQPLWRRISGVGREWLTGRYGRFGTGARSAIRDLLRIG